MKKTRRERIADFLLANGYTEESLTSRKYRKFTHPRREHPLWLGKAGALRSGRIASDTVNAVHLVPKKVLADVD